MRHFELDGFSIVLGGGGRLRLSSGGYLKFSRARTEKFRVVEMGSWKDEMRKVIPTKGYPTIEQELKRRDMLKKMAEGKAPEGKGKQPWQTRRKAR